MRLIVQKQNVRVIDNHHKYKGENQGYRPV